MVPAAQFSGCGVRGTALRIRYGRHLRRDESAERNVCTIAVDAGHYRLQRAVGDGSRFIRRGGAQRSIRTAPLPSGARRLIPSFFRRLCLRLELGRTDCVSRYRGTGYWRIIRDWSHVHRRNLTGCQAWTPGRALSDERGCRDSAGLSLELSRRIRRIRRIRVALEIRDGRDPGGRISVCPFRNPGKPSMVDRGGPDGGSPRSFERVGEQDPERDLHEIAKHYRGRAEPEGSRYSSRVTASRFSLRSRSACSTSSRESTRFCTISTTFSNVPDSARFRAICKRLPSASPTLCSRSSR